MKMEIDQKRIIDMMGVLSQGSDEEIAERVIRLEDFREAIAEYAPTIRDNFMRLNEEISNDLERMVAESCA